MTFPPPGGSEPPGHDQSFLERQNIHPIVFAFGCLAGIFVLYQLVAGSITFLIVGSNQITRENVGLVRLLTMAGQIFFILVPTLLLGRLLSHKSSMVFPWRVPRMGETISATLSLLFLQQLFQVYLFFQDRIPLPEALRKIVDPVKEMMEVLFRNLVQAESVPELLLVILVVAVVPAIVEEMFFRGLIQSAFEKAVPPLWAAMLVGVIFGLYHFNPFALVPLVGLGSFFGFLRFRSGSVVIAMTAHFFNNAMAVVAVYFSMENGILMGSEGAPEPSVGGAIAQFFLYLALFAFFFSAYIRLTGRRQEKE